FRGGVDADVGLLPTHLAIIAKSSTKYVVGPRTVVRGPTTEEDVRSSVGFQRPAGEIPSCIPARPRGLPAKESATPEITLETSKCGSIKTSVMPATEATP